ncbi:unnamed protein product [Arabidopsis halleri]
MLLVFVFLCRILLLLIWLPLTRSDWGLLLTSLFSTMRFSTHLILHVVSQSRSVLLSHLVYGLCYALCY